MKEDDVKKYTLWQFFRFLTEETSIPEDTDSKLKVALCPYYLHGPSPPEDADDGQKK